MDASSSTSTDLAAGSADTGSISNAGGTGGSFDFSGLSQSYPGNATTITPTSGETTIQASNQSFIVQDAGGIGSLGSMYGEEILDFPRDAGKRASLET